MCVYLSLDLFDALPFVSLLNNRATNTGIANETKIALKWLLCTFYCVKSEKYYLRKIKTYWPLKTSVLLPRLLYNFSITFFFFFLRFCYIFVRKMRRFAMSFICFCMFRLLFIWTLKKFPVRQPKSKDLKKRIQLLLLRKKKKCLSFGNSRSTWMKITMQTKWSWSSEWEKNWTAKTFRRWSFWAEV